MICCHAPCPCCRRYKCCSRCGGWGGGRQERAHARGAAVAVAVAVAGGRRCRPPRVIVRRGAWWGWGEQAVVGGSGADEEGLWVGVGGVGRCWRVLKNETHNQPTHPDTHRHPHTHLVVALHVFGRQLQRRGQHLVGEAVDREAPEVLVWVSCWCVCVLCVCVWGGVFLLGVYVCVFF